MVENNDDHVLVSVKTGRSISISEESFQALKFRDQVMAMLGNPDDAISQIKELADIKTEIALGTIGSLSSQSETIIQLKSFRDRVKEALPHPDRGELTDDLVVDTIHNLRSEKWQYWQILEELCYRLNVNGDDRFEKLKTIINVDGIDKNEISEIEMLKNENESLQKELINLSRVVNDLRVANKVIARLVGE